MPNAGGHYEQAFASFLERTGTDYFRINQSRKAAGADGPLKSFDFLVYPDSRRPLLVDVKGRRLASRSYHQGRLGQNWVGSDDLDLHDWEERFDRPVVALFVFAYWIYDLPSPDHYPGWQAPPNALLYYHGRRFYSLMGVELADYRRRMKPRSPRWRTVFLPVADFAAIARPFEPQHYAALCGAAR